ncbi:MAG: hypothetical protein JO297_19500 [Nitrososphaeraceae archaeon]|nr:hypothetical protein [Nitrososphaeraceae archaeon]
MMGHLCGIDLQLIKSEELLRKQSRPGITLQHARFRINVLLLVIRGSRVAAESG